MKYISVCSGIEAATVAWQPFGWKATAFSEIDRFPCAVLKHHYPDTPNWGDMTKYKEWPDATISLLVGGTPCQSFSVAGLRKGLDDPRGNLMLTYLAIADRYRPAWLVWENVPGVLSSNGGRDFGTFLGALGELGYGFAYRVLDAQYFGVPQRRRRVFVIGYLGDWRPAAAVLFERHSLSGDTPPSREKGQGITENVAICIDEECNATTEGYGPLLRGGQGGTRQAVMCQPIANPLTARMAKGINTTCDEGQTMVACFTQNHAQDSRVKEIDMPSLNAKAGTGGNNLPLVQQIAVANAGYFGTIKAVNVADSLRAKGGDTGNGGETLICNTQVRRLTERECERL